MRLDEVPDLVEVGRFGTHGFDHLAADAHADDLAFGFIGHIQHLGVDLDDDRITDALRGLHGALGVVDDRARGHRDAVAAEQRRHLAGAKLAALGAQRRFDDGARTLRATTAAMIASSTIEISSTATASTATSRLIAASRVARTSTPTIAIASPRASRIGA